jgi:prepilin signal peptidase PulO-like enzyme (type II secretory pathway)
MTLWYLLFLFIIGLAFGSFLSVAIHRIHSRKKGLVGGRSACPRCGHVLGVAELVPLLSYFWQAGRCRHCGQSIGWHYPVLELSTGMMFVAVAVSGLTPLPLTLFYGLVLIFIFFYDLLHMEIPDEVMLPSIAIAFIGSLFSPTISLSNALIGATIITGFFLLQIVVSKGKWLGGGDLRIGAFMGLILGWQYTLVALFVSYLVGSLISVSLLLTGRLSRKSQVPFGPFLVIGTLAALFYGEILIKRYFELTLF